MNIDNLVGQIAELSSDGIFVADLRPSGSSSPTIVWCNQSVCDQTGFLKEELIDKPLYKVIGGNKHAKMYVELVARMGQKAPIRKRFENFDKDEQAYLACLSLQPVNNNEFPNRYWIGIQRDNTENEILRSDLETARQELRLYKQRLWDAIDALPDAFVMYDVNDLLVVCNSKYKEFYAASAPAIYPGASFQDIMRYGVENGQYPEAIGREEEWLEEWHEWHLERRKSSTKPLERELPGDRHILIHDVETENGDIVGLRTDVTELTQKKRELEKLTISLEEAREQAETASRTDSLTSVGNRRGLEIFMGQVAKPAKIKFEAAFIHLDLDYFKDINDVYGHAAGDRVLRHVADALRKSTRPEDYVARIGGDEFVVVLLSKKAQKAAETIAKRVIAACNETVVFDGHTLKFGASIGIAVSKQDSLDRLQSRSDEALYEAKAQGRGRFVSYVSEAGE